MQGQSTHTAGQHNHEGDIPSPARCSKPAASDPPYSLDCEEPVYAALTNPEPPEHAGPDLRNQRQEHGLTIRDLADHLDVTYQRLRRLEIGLRNDPELEHRATIALDQLAREGAP